ncbi:hypothetical protein [Okeania sp. KiyG1]|uniref:hypothetical protein n=1 Tax=Okeania sp. KiyG1 TaxID=2720165 RepID=UPI001924A515|nr:hypothetical protein [Okeania sp. KiyG1]GGA13952.1 hypothetical protein CYANOKiyG1_27460 [Okeania sp. KiyG1]
MPRGGRRHGYDWGISKKDQTSVTVPKAIAERVKEIAQEIWEEEKAKEQEDDQEENDDTQE